MPIDTFRERYSTPATDASVQTLLDVAQERLSSYLTGTTTVYDACTTVILWPPAAGILAVNGVAPVGDTQLSAGGRVYSNPSGWRAGDVITYTPATQPLYHASTVEDLAAIHLRKSGYEVVQIGQFNATPADERMLLRQYYETAVL